MSDHRQNAGEQPEPEIGQATLSGMALIDLNEFGIPAGPRPCEVKFDPVGRPEVVVVGLPESAEVINNLLNNPESLRDKTVEVELDNGRKITAKAEMAGSWTGGLGHPITAEVHITDSTIQQPGIHSTDRWMLRLTNVRIRSGDRVRQVTSGKVTKFIRDTIVFNVADREWVLVDELWEQWQDGHKPDISKPLVSGRLETAYQAGDTRERIEAIAEEIEALLRLALGRGISWISCKRMSGDEEIESHESSTWTPPFGQASPVIPNILPYQIKSFIEVAHLIMSDERNWYLSTITQYVVAILGNHLEIRMALQNTLLDRIAAKVLQHDAAAEIDEDMPERMTKDWRKRLHALMTEASPHWTSDRTGRLIGNIKQWNSGPSFPGGVERAAVRLGLWPPSKNQLAKRHKLIHLGEYDGDDGMSIIDYWQEMECLVTMMLLRLLGYRGYFYHHALGPDGKNLKDVMLGGNGLPPYRLDKTVESQLPALAEVASYRLWQDRGEPLGDDWADWFHAEEVIHGVLDQLKNGPAVPSENQEFTDA